MATFWEKGLTPSMAKKAKEELGETPEVRKEGLAKLKRLIEDEAGFKPLMDDEFLTRFLRAKKYDVKRAFKTLLNYYSYKTRYAGLITNFSPKDLKDVFALNKVMVPPRRGRGDEGVIMASIGCSPEGDCTVEQHMAAIIVAAEIGIETDGSQVCGSAILIDMQGLTWAKARQYFNLSFLIPAIRGLQDCWPYRITRIHLVNEPHYFGVTYKLIYPFLSKKMRERIHFHGEDLDSLHQYFSADILPEKLGGNLTVKDFDNLRNILLRNNAIMDRINHYMYKGVRYPQEGTSSDSTDATKCNESIRTLFDVSFKGID